MPEDDRERLDVALVRLGLAASRTEAQRSIEAGLVRIDGRVASRASEQVSATADLAFERAHPGASRGGLKLDHALTTFGIDATGRACLDLGASTGGFTDVLLARGARSVTAVDVGRDQLIARLKADPRVRSLEGRDARDLSLDLIGAAPSLIVCDASYIGLAKLLPVPLSLATPEADLVALFKPQFEVGPAHVGKGGIVTDLVATERAAAELETFLAAAGWRIRAWTPSPILGGDGNHERLFAARRA